MNRRALLGSAFAIATGHRFSGSLYGENPQSSRITPKQFRDRLRGPILSVPTPFTSQFGLDSEGLQRMIRQAINYGIRIFELTSGDSQFSYLSYAEIKELTRTTVEIVAQRGMVIAATGPWWTSRAIEFAEFAESIGATALQVLPPSNVDDARTYEHFRQIARSTPLPIVLHGHYSKSLLSRLVRIDPIVALKEDVSLSYFIETLIHFGARLNCFSGGSYQWFLCGQPYGATAYFDIYSTFYPPVSKRFWKAVQSKDYSAETAIIESYDHPLVIDHFSVSFWHATLEYFGVAQRYLRAPQHTYTDQDMRSVKEFFDKLDLHPRGLKN